MTCPDAREWDLLVMEVLEDDQAEPLLAHARACPACRKLYDAARREHIDRVRMYEAFDRNHDELREQLMAALPDEPPQRSGTDRLVRGWYRLGDYVMSMNATTARRATALLAPAACILIAIVIFFSPGQKSAFAAALEHLRQARTIVCHVVTTMELDMRVDPELWKQKTGSSETPPGINGPSTVTTEDVKLYISDEHGVRRDRYEDGKLVMETFIADPEDPKAFYLYPVEEDYQHDQEVPEAFKKALKKGMPDLNYASLVSSPDRLLRGLQSWTSEADKELGEDTIDGRAVLGFEIAGEKVGFGPPLTDRSAENHAELWIDANTKLPVRLVFSYVTSVPPLPLSPVPMSASWVIKTVYDDFEWDPNLPADWFKPDVPESYTERPAAPWPWEDIPDEASLIESLRMFSELGGRYPHSLSTMSLCTDISLVAGMAQARRIAAQQAGEDVSNLPSPDASWAQALYTYTFLWGMGLEPEYFGDTVKPGDADAVLMKWKLEDGSTRIIHGDLTAETR